MDSSDLFQEENDLLLENPEVPINNKSSEGQICESFAAMNLKNELLQSLQSRGYETPSVIHQQFIPPCVQGLDVLVEAPSGSSKTLGLSIAVLQKLDISLRDCQALILVPNRELAQAMNYELMELGEPCGAQCHTSIEEVPVLQEVQRLKEGPHVVVGTPGRVKHMILAKYLDTQNVKMLILYEANKLLPYDFKEEIYDIFQRLDHAKIQVVLLSETISSELLNMTKRFMRDPIKIQHKSL